jgi:hypothetical protein
VKPDSLPGLHYNDERPDRNFTSRQENFYFWGIFNRLTVGYSLLPQNCWTKAVQQNQSHCFSILAILAIRMSYEIANIFG